MHKPDKAEQISLPLTTNKHPITRIIGPDNNEELLEKCKALGFFKSFCEFISPGLHYKFRVDTDIPRNILYSHSLFESLPIYRINFTKTPKDRRTAALQFVRDIRHILEEYLYKCAPSKGAQIAVVLYEIAKNIADHTVVDGFIGLDITRMHNKTTISILIGDTGPGVYAHLRDSFRSKNPERYKKADFTEIWHYALQDGITGSRASKGNFGAGMSLIVNNCRALGVRISAFDHRRRVFLSGLAGVDMDNASHNKLGHVCYNFEGDRPFTYYLEWEL